MAVGAGADEAAPRRDLHGAGAGAGGALARALLVLGAVAGALGLGAGAGALRAALAGFVAIRIAATRRTDAIDGRPTWK